MCVCFSFFHVLKTESLRRWPLNMIPYLICSRAPTPVTRSNTVTKPTLLVFRLLLYDCFTWSYLCISPCDTSLVLLLHLYINDCTSPNAIFKFFTNSLLHKLCTNEEWKRFFLYVHTRKFFRPSYMLLKRKERETWKIQKMYYYTYTS